MRHTRRELTTSRSFNLSSRCPTPTSVLSRNVSPAMHPTPPSNTNILDAQHPLLRLKSTALSFLPAIVTTRPEPEFQSNIGVESLYSPLAYKPALAGLGIRCAQPLVSRSSVVEAQEEDQKDSLNSLSIKDISLQSSPAVPLPDSGAEYNAMLEHMRETDLSMFRTSTIDDYTRSELAYTVSPVPESTGDDYRAFLAALNSGTTSSAMARQTTFFPETERNSPVTVGLFPDINMFKLIVSRPDEEYQGSINPAEIMDDMNAPLKEEEDVDSPLPPSSSPLFSPPSPPPTVVSPSTNTISAEVMQDIVAILSAAVKKEENEGRASAKKVQSDHSACMSSKMASPTTGPDAAYTASERSSPEQPVFQPLKRKQPVPREPINRSASTYDPFGTSPVLNAHEGVSLATLTDKAALYRIRYPGEAISSKWLMAYAGKLSERGQLIDDFRCYVTGCTQTNKRRDHMMVHVGAHVDQRPFACSSCPMHFLRRNECKRHEASHTGSKPFTCHLCSRYDNKSFARQDLLKRHLNRAHGFDTSANKENVPARKKSRVE